MLRLLCFCVHKQPKTVLDYIEDVCHNKKIDYDTVEGATFQEDKRALIVRFKSVTERDRKSGEIEKHLQSLSNQIQYKIIPQEEKSEDVRIKFLNLQVLKVHEIILMESFDDINLVTPRLVSSTQ